jgi:hypothetical protein
MNVYIEMGHAGNGVEWAWENPPFTQRIRELESCGVGNFQIVYLFYFAVGIL